MVLNKLVSSRPLGKVIRDWWWCLVVRILTRRPARAVRNFLIIQINHKVSTAMSGNDSPVQEDSKRKRGRPAKPAGDTAKEAPAKEAKKRPASADKEVKKADEATPAKRGRGRPKGSTKKSKAKKATKPGSRGRGRPRKEEKKPETASEEDAEEEDEEDELE